MFYNLVYIYIFSYFSFLITHILKLLTNLLGRYARIVDHLAVRDAAQGAPLGGGSTLMEYWLFSLLLLRDYSLSLGILCLFWMVLMC